MNTRASLAALSGAVLMLAACGSADDASTEATADTVEMPADEALEAISDEPVADPDATATDAPDIEGEAGAEVEATTEEAADAAADVAAEAAAAAEQASE